MSSVADVWRGFLCQWVFARECPLYYGIVSGFRTPPRNPFLESFLPSLLQVKTIAILDAALNEALIARNVKPKDHGFKNDLNGRIRTAEVISIIPNGPALHADRGTRNDIAHELNPSVSWDELEGTIRNVHGALESLGLVGPMPTLRVTADRVPTFPESEEAGFIVHFDYRVTILDENDNRMAEISWAEELGAPARGVPGEVAPGGFEVT